MPVGQEMPEERRVALGVELLHPRHGIDPADEERQHRPDPLNAAVRLEALLQERASPFELLVDRGIAQAPQDGDPGRRRERVPREGARLVDVADRREAGHDLPAAAERRQRQPAADDLPEDRQVGPDAVALLGAAAGDAKAGDHLVEHEQRARDVAERAQRLQEAGLRRDAAHVAGHRLDEDRREVLAVALDRRCRKIDVVVVDDDGVGDDRSRHAGGRRDPERGEPGPRLGEERIGMPVVAAGELQDLRAAGEGACEPKRRHRRLGARRDEPNLLDRGHGVGDLGGELHLALGRRTEARPGESGLANRLDRLGIGVPEDERAPRLHPVEQPAPIGRLEVGPVAAGGEEGLGARRRRASRGPAS